MVRGPLLMVVVGLCLVGVLAGCGDGSGDGKKESKTTEKATSSAKPSVVTESKVDESMTEAAEKMPSQDDMARMAEDTKKKLAEFNQGEEIEAVDFRQLKALLPESLAGMERTDAQGERMQMMGVNTAHAEGTYEATDESGGMIEIRLTDLGNTSGAAAMGVAGWAMMDYDREEESSYERTMSYQGCKGVEEYDTDMSEGTVRVLVGKRFMVEVEGSEVPMETIKAALERIDLKKLEALEN